MSGTTQHVIEVATSTKTGFVGILMANISALWMDYGSVLVTAATGLCGLAYAVIMIMLKWQEYKIKKRENKAAETLKPEGDK